MIARIKIGLAAFFAFAAFAAFAQTSHTESFDGTTFQPSGWTLNGTYISSTYMQRVTSSTSETASPHSGAGFCRFRSAGGTVPNGGSGNLVTPKIDYTNRGGNTPTLSCWVYRDVNATYNTSTYDLEGISVYVHTTTAITSGTLLGFIPRRGGLATSGTYLTAGTSTVSVAGWYQYTFSIPAAYTTCAYAGFKFVSKAGRNIYIDDINYTSYPASAPGCATIISPSNGGTGTSPINPSLVLSWTAPAACAEISGYKLYLGTDAAATNIINGTNIGTVTTYTTTGLAANTLYYWKVVPTGPIGDATGCSIWSFTTGAANPGCTAGATSWGGNDDSGPTDYITQVDLGSGVGSISRYSGAWGSESYVNTGLSMNVVIGTSYPFYISSSALQDDNVYVYVDWNQDGDFSDANENPVQGWTSTTNPWTYVNTTLVPPAGALAGSTVMRVVMWDAYNYGSYPPAPSPAGCGDVYYGEVEDYNLVVCNTQITTQPTSAPTVCSNATATLSAVTSGATSHQWQYSANNSTWSNVANGTPAGVTYTGATTATLTATGFANTATSYYYKLNASSAACTATSNTVTLTVRTISTDPTSLSAGSYTICPGNSTNLTINGGSKGFGANWKWYSGSCGGTLAGTTSTNTLAVTPGSTTVYYARAEGTCNNTACVTNTVVVGGAPSTAATGISASSTNICNGSSATLTVSGGTLGAGANWMWYSGTCGGTYVGTGTSIVVSPGATTTYFVRAEGCNVTGCPTGKTITVINIPACNTTTAPFNGATGQCRNTTLTWNTIAGATGYKVYVGTDAAATNIMNGTNVGNVTTYTVSTLAASTLHYWKIVPTNTCGDASGCTIKSFTTGTIPCYCASQSNWGGGNDGGGNPVDWITDVYYGSINRSVAWFEGYANTGAATNVVIGNAMPFQMWTTANQGNYVEVYVDWNQDGDFLDASPTETVISTWVGTGGYLSQNITPPSGALPGSTIMRVILWDDNEGWTPSGGCGEVYYGEVEDYIVTVCATQITTQPPATPTVCASIGTATLAAVSSGATSHQWQYSPNNISWSNVANGTPAGVTYTGATTATLTATGFANTATSYYYKLNANSAACTAVSNTVTLTARTISTDPTSLTAGSYTICPGNSTNLTINGGSKGFGANWKWYSGSCGGTLVATTSSNTLAVTPGSTTVYYARAEGTCNNTACVSTTVTVGGTPSSPATSISASSTNICNGGSTTLTANGGTLGAWGTWTWYSGSCGGTLIGTGNPIVVSPTVTTTYYVRAEGCNITTCPAGRTITVTNIPACNTLSLPWNGQTGVCRNPTLTWNTISGATAYKVYVGTDAAATNIINGTNVGNVLSYTVPTLAVGTLHYWKIVPLNSCGDATGCTIRSFTTGSDVCYCTAQAGQGGGQNGDTPPVDYDYIAGVYIGTISRSSGWDYYYNTGLTSNAIVGTNYPLTVYGTASQPSYVAAYADWNQDGDFQDAGETLINNVWASNGTYTANVTPPGTALYGNTTLRIMMWDEEDGWTPSPAGCGDVQYGDVEDYTLIVCNTSITGHGNNAAICAGGSATFGVTATGATSYQWQRYNAGTWVNVANGTPTGATYSGATTATMTVSGVTASGTTYYRCAVVGACTFYSNQKYLSVNAAPACNSLTSPANGATNQCKNLTLSWGSVSNTSGYKLYFGTDAAATNIYNGVNQGYAYSKSLMLSANTTYYWKVVPWNSCGDASGCTIRSFTTGSTVCYCAVNGAYWYNYIDGVTIGTISNLSNGNSTYSDYSTQSTQVLIGSSYNLTVYSQADTVNNYCRAWVDWNQDGDFTDANELVLDGWNDYYYSATITPPAGAVGGITRLRIVLTDDSYGYNPSDGCGNNYAGEAEDYRLDVCGVSISTQPTSAAACVNSGSGSLGITAVSASSYQWQYKNGASWMNLANGTPAGSTYSGATTATMTVSGINTTGNYQYRCNAIGSCTITSSTGTVTVISGVPGLATYTFPSNGATNQCSNSYTSLNWTAASNYPSGYKLYFGTDAAATNIVNGINIGNVLTYNPLPLSNNTTYYWKIVPWNNCGDATGATIRSFTTGSACYCVPNYSYNGCSINMYISNFTTTGGATNINNTSTCGGTNYFSDYTGLSLSLVSGNAFNFTVTQASTVYNTGFRMWIDYNGDYDFADAGEDVWNSGSAGKTFSGTIIVPSGTTPGTKRLRIRNQYSSVPATTDYCSTLTYGETEDYSIVVVAPCVAPTTQASGITFSGIVCDQMTLNWTSGNGSKRLVVAKASSTITGTPANSTTYTANSAFGSGGFIATGEYVVYNGTGNSVSLTGLTQGVTYYFKVFEYNCTPGWEEYLTTSPASGSQASSAPSAPMAGADQYICAGVTSTTMAASGSGTWSQISGPNTPNIISPTSASTQIGTTTGLITGTYVFRWSGTCGGTYDDVRIVCQ